MKIAIVKEHRDFYKKNGWIEFENFFTDDQIDLFNHSIDQVLKEALKVSEARILAVSADNAFQHGRDLWRLNEPLKKLIFLPKVAEIVSELIELKPLRIGFDQFLPPFPSDVIKPSLVYKKYLKEEQSLENSSCIKGLVAGLIICLNASTEKKEMPECMEGCPDIFPNQMGNAIIFNPQKAFDFTLLSKHPHQRYLLITYAQNSSYYYLQPDDPHTHHLKKYGYIYHDKLSEKINPTIYR